MKYVPILAPITPLRVDGKPILDEDKKAPAVITMRDWFLRFMADELNDPLKPNAGHRIGDGALGSARLNRVARALGGATGTLGKIEDDDFAKLVELVNAKMWPAATFGAQFADFDEAILRGAGTEAEALKWLQNNHPDLLATTAPDPVAMPMRITSIASLE